MAFTVSRPEGVQRWQIDAFLRLWKRDGKDMGCAPRVQDPRGGLFWLPAWPDRAAAEEFAVRLEPESEIDGWEVYEVSADPLPPGPLAALEVRAVRLGGGECAYVLEGNGEWVLSWRFPTARRVASLSMESFGDVDPIADQSRYWDQVAAFLTGLSEAEMAEFGGYRVFDSKGDRVLRDAPGLPTTHVNGAAPAPAATAAATA